VGVYYPADKSPNTTWRPAADDLGHVREGPFSLSAIRGFGLASRLGSPRSRREARSSNITIEHVSGLEDDRTRDCDDGQRSHERPDFSSSQKGSRCPVASGNCARAYPTIRGSHVVVGATAGPSSAGDASRAIACELDPHSPYSIRWMLGGSPPDLGRFS
jgi:hypothetical protein